MFLEILGRAFVWISRFLCHHRCACAIKRSSPPVNSLTSTLSSFLDTMTDKVVSVIGSGDVGTVLANGFLKYGFTVVRGSRDPPKFDEWLATAEPKDKASAATFDDASRKGEIIVLCVKGAIAEDALDLCGSENLAGKIVIDATNPIVDPPGFTDGVLHFFTGPNDSLMERLQTKVPDAKFVKAFSCIVSSCCTLSSQHDYK